MHKPCDNQHVKTCDYVAWQLYVNTVYCWNNDLYYLVEEWFRGDLLRHAHLLLLLIRSIVQIPITLCNNTKYNGMLFIYLFVGWFY